MSSPLFILLLLSNYWCYGGYLLYISFLVRTYMCTLFFAHLVALSLHGCDLIPNSMRAVAGPDSYSLII